MRCWSSRAIAGGGDAGEAGGGYAGETRGGDAGGDPGDAGMGSCRKDILLKETRHVHIASREIVCKNKTPIRGLRHANILALGPNHLDIRRC